MKPKLRDDVRYVPSAEGVQVFSSTGSFGLQGASLAPLLDQLVGYLDGTHTVDAIVAGLPDRHRRVVTKLIDTLVERRAAYDAAAALPHRLQEWELARYRQEIAFAELASGSGAHWFERFRLAKVLLAGAGGPLDALVRTMLQLGARGAGVLVPPDLAGHHDRWRSYLEAGRRDDPLLRLAEVPVPTAGSSVAEVGSWLAGYDAVLHCDDRPLLGRATVLTRAARALRIPALHAVLVGDCAWVGPAAAGDDLGCWECAWRYLIGARSRSDPDWQEHQLRDPVTPQPAPWASEPICGLVGAVLAMAYFRLVTEAGVTGAATRNRLIRIDPETGTAAEHRFTPHPGCRACPRPVRPDRSGLARRIDAARESPARTDDDLSGAAAALHDPELGTILSLDEGDRLQLPQVVTVAAVNDLSGSGAGAPTVTAAAPDHARARLRAAAAALETAAGLAAAAPDTGPDTGPVPDPGAEPDTGGGPADQPDWVWDLAAQAVVAAPGVGAGTHRTVAAGYRWAEAVGRGLLRLHLRLSRDRAADGAGAAGRPPPAPLPDAARQLVEAAETLGVRLRLADLTGPSGVPTVAVYGGGTPVLAAALDLPSAVVTALEAAVGRVQSTMPRPSAAADRPAEREPRDRAPARETDAGEVPADLGDPRWPEELAGLVRRLAGQGWRLLARPVTLPLAAALADQLPLLAEVTLTRDPPGTA